MRHIIPPQLTQKPTYRRGNTGGNTQSDNPSERAGRNGLPRLVRFARAGKFERFDTADIAGHDEEDAHGHVPAPKKEADDGQSEGEGESEGISWTGEGFDSVGCQYEETRDPSYSLESVPSRAR
jgi:hypothetical protein